MALALKNQIEMIEVMENFLIGSRPPEEIRSQLDFNYKIQDQSIIVFEIRPIWNSPKEKMECNIAKATFVKKDNTWKIFWFMSDMKWHSYKANPKVKNLNDFVKIIKEDKHGCFWG